MNISRCGNVARLILLGAVLAVGSRTVTAQGQEARSVRELRKVFSSIVAFGDSLTDTGNLFAVTGLPPRPYFKGRISNGVVWIEYLAKKLRLKKSLTNYAFAGATTGRDNVNDVPGQFEFPGVLDQIDAFESDLAGQQADSDALYVLWGGSNDVVEFGPTQQTVDDGVANTIEAIQRLHDLGARHILVVNVADIGLTPFGQSEGPAELSMFVDVYNAALGASLDVLSDFGIHTLRLDSAQILRDVVENPDDYRLKNVTDAVLQAGGPARRFLFWDTLHPTTKGHKIFSEAALRVLIDGFISPTPSVMIRASQNTRRLNSTLSLPKLISKPTLIPVALSSSSCC